MSDHINHDFIHSQEKHILYVVHLQGTESVIQYNWHKEQELILVEEGTLELHVDDTVLVVHKGEIGCVNTGRMHYALSEKRGTVCKVTCFLFDLVHALSLNGTTDDEHIKGLAHGVLNFLPVIKSDSPYALEILTLLHEGASAYDEKIGPYELQLKATVFSLFYIFNQIPDFFLHLKDWDNARSRERRDRIFAVFDFVEKNYTEPISVTDLSNHIKMGSDTFYKFFTSITGMSPVNYIIKVRLEKAEELLATTDSSVTDVCFQTGFSNVSYFIRQYKKKYGMTPNQNRKSKGKITD